MTKTANSTLHAASSQEREHYEQSFRQSVTAVGQGIETLNDMQQFSVFVYDEDGKPVAMEGLAIVAMLGGSGNLAIHVGSVNALRQGLPSGLAGHIQRISSPEPVKTSRWYTVICPDGYAASYRMESIDATLGRFAQLHPDRVITTVVEGRITDRGE
jgi:hypothetical protein